MSKNRFLFLFAFALIVATGLLAQTGEAAATSGETRIGNSAEAVYADLLESLLAKNYRRAKEDGDLLASKWPGSPYAAKAEEMLARYSPRRDTSGIVPFYIGNLGTGVSVSAILPASIIGRYIDDEAANGVLYLGGAAAGLGSAWFMSHEGDFSLAKEIWIESVAATASASWFMLYDAWVPASYSGADTMTMSPRDRVEMFGLSSALIAGRGLTWAYLRDSSPSLGRAAFAAQSSAWSLFYSFTLMMGVLQVEDQRILSTTIAGAMDAGLVLGAYAWDNLGWSAYRSGLVSVGGIAGFLFAAGVNMIANGIAPNLDGRVLSGMIAVGALAGQAVAIGLTKNMEPESPGMARLQFGAYPVLASGHFGVGVSGFIPLD